MSNADPNMHWDGQQWLRWDGAHWAPASPALQPGYQALGPPSWQHAPNQTVAPGYGVAQVMGPPGLLTDKRDRTTQAVIAWIFTVLTIGYFLPWAIAATRGKANSGMVGLLNFLLGWTFIGWVVALVMACTSHQVVAATPGVTLVNYTGYYPAAPGLAPGAPWAGQPSPTWSMPGSPPTAIPSSPDRFLDHATWESPAMPPHDADEWPQAR